MGVLPKALTKFRQGDYAVIRKLDDPELNRLYCGYTVRVIKVRPSSKLAYVTTDRVSFKQPASFNAWFHFSELDYLDLKAFKESQKFLQQCVMLKTKQKYIL